MKIRCRLCAAIWLATLFALLPLAGCAPTKSESAAINDENDGIVLRILIDCEEPIYSLSCGSEAQTTAVSPADNTPFKRGEQIELGTGKMETDSYTVRAYGENQVLLAESTYAYDPSTIRELALTLDESLRFLLRNETPAPAYSIMHIGQDGEVLAVLSTPQSEELAADMIMSSMLRSAAWPGGDVSALKEHYLIRQSFGNGETHDFYAYILEEGDVRGAVLQAGTNGFYTAINDELYQRLEDMFAQ